MIWFIDAQDRNTASYWALMVPWFVGRRNAMPPGYVATEYYMFEFSEDLLELDQDKMVEFVKEVQRWCDEHFEDRWVNDGIAFMFREPQDAFLFKLKWC